MDLQKLGFSRVIYKNDTLRLFFVENAQSVYFESETFQQIMQFVAQHGAAIDLRIKENRNRLFLIKDEVDELDDIVDILHKIINQVKAKEDEHVATK